MTEWGVFGHIHFMLSVDRCFMKFFEDFNRKYTNSWCLAALFIPQFIISCNQESSYLYLFHYLTGITGYLFEIFHLTDEPKPDG